MGNSCLVPIVWQCLRIKLNQGKILREEYICSCPCIVIDSALVQWDCLAKYVHVLFVVHPLYKISLWALSIGFESKQMVSVICRFSCSSEQALDHQLQP